MLKSPWYVAAFKRFPLKGHWMCMVYNVTWLFTRLFIHYRIILTQYEWHFDLDLPSPKWYLSFTIILPPLTTNKMFCPRGCVTVRYLKARLDHWDDIKTCFIRHIFKLQYDSITVRNSYCYLKCPLYLGLLIWKYFFV